MSSNKMRFGEYLLSKNLIDNSDLRIALNKQRDSNSKYSQLGNVIYALSILDEEVLCSALSEFEGIEYMPITNINLENYGERLLNIIERKDIIDHKMLPVYVNDIDKEIGIATIEQSPQKLEYLNSFLRTMTCTRMYRQNTIVTQVPGCIFTMSLMTYGRELTGEIPRSELAENATPNAIKNSAIQ